MFNTKTSLVALCTATILITGCSQEPPVCSDEQTYDLVRGVIIDQIDNQGLSESQLKENLRFEFARATAYDEKIKKYSCTAKLISGNFYQVPITYESQLNDNNEHIISFDGISPVDWRGIQSGLIKVKLENEAKKVKEVPSSQTLAIIGKWDGKMHDADGSVSMDITTSNNGYNISMSAGAEGCGGDLEGQGILTGNILMLKQKDGEDPCSIKIEFNGNTAEVTEEDCMSYHGAACSFSSTLNKI